ncbi:MAG TPA: hypothetical protein VIJ31_04080 [Acidothermaceae bacterium]
MTATTRRPASIAVGFAALCVCLASCSAKSNNAQASAGTSKADVTAAAASDATAQASASADGSTPADGAAPAHGSIDPCSLLTDAEASTALGGPAAHKVADPKAGIGGADLPVTENLCSYNLITSDQTGHEIYIGVFDGANRKYFDETANDSDHSAVPGLGDSATADAQIDVFVFSKGTMLEIYGSLGDGDQLQQIAKLAIAKL